MTQGDRQTPTNPGANPSTGKGAEARGDGGARRVASVRGTKGDVAKEARVKAALKANIARRKAQAKARREDETSDD